VRRETKIQNLIQHHKQYLMSFRPNPPAGGVVEKSQMTYFVKFYRKSS